ncbi:hypothetical protein GCM10027261_30740 [Geodermatophilus arenarius]|uniref:Uncharacterized protein n=1 Tax=Geodermatophilus arenarius TaxID=1137990 RepID=A0ABV9LLX0_9ACTN
MTDEVPRIERHEAADRAGKAALRAAHDLTVGLSSDDDVPEPVVVRRGGPHRSVGGLADLIDSALQENEALQEDEGLQEDEALEEDEAVRENERESGEPGS